ncbi:hypothetical protein BCR37DRAFT_385055 [Protomyces lactucae-debilis]|uniref:t-SNARE coiled-coil homology domain-containing protein n=1 Tax=Protomyces lactucae-debilis TaxID=2754530 RepID=A0A1Y2FUX9_PROLT|nr:uncharacterized protein BCR37DRAFT_385055 [Protomyces lactucae-debilis]ORY87769.1 hypothetical protein BCR37DRAFT_385055 [Protomyces lactucae-debilis]
MASRLHLLAEQLQLSIVERQRLTAAGIDTSPDDDDEMYRSLATLQQGLRKLSGNGSIYLTEAQEDELSQLKQKCAKLCALLPGSILDLQEPYRDNLDSSAKSPKDNVASKKRDLLDTSSTRKSVRFSDHPSHDSASNEDLLQAQSVVMAAQDQSLDVLSTSISRQRELSIQIGDELDGQSGLLNEVDDMVTRSASRLDSANRRLTSFTRAARENSRLTAIFLLILVLFLLLIVL